MTSTVTELRGELAALIGALDPAAVAPRDAKRMVEELAEMGRLVAAGQMLLAPKVAETALWRAKGDRTPQEWLSREARCSIGEAAGLLAAGRKLAGLPVAEAAMRAGKLSLPQAREIAQTAEVVPDAAALLVATAERDSLRALKEKGQRMRVAATDSHDRQAKIRAARSLTTSTDDEGAFCLQARGPASDGARLLAALYPYQQARFVAGRASGEHEGIRAMAFDALIDLATSHTGVAPSAVDESHTAAPPQLALVGAGRSVGGSGDHGVTGGTEAATDLASGAPAAGGASAAPSPRLPPTGMKLIMKIDHTALLRGYSIEGETCEIAGLGPVPVAAIRELMDDAFLAAVVTKGVDIMSVTHLGRRPSAAQLTALQWRSPSCIVEGCTQSVGIEHDHQIDWAITHHTRLDETEPKCSHHHRLKTVDGWRLVPGTGRRPMVPPPDGSDAADGPDPPDG